MTQFSLRILVPCSAMIVLAFGPAAAHAQTGPIGKVSKISPNTPSVSQGLTVNRMVTLLKAKGAATEVKTADNKGTRITTITASLEQNEFKYVFNVVHLNPGTGQAVWFFSSVLNDNARDIPLEKLQGLLKENFTMAGTTAFMINQQGGLQLNSHTMVTNANDQYFNSELDFFLKDVRETSNLWLSGQ